MSDYAKSEFNREYHEVTVRKLFRLAFLARLTCVLDFRSKETGIWGVSDAFTQYQNSHKQKKIYTLDYELSAPFIPISKYGALQNILAKDANIPWRAFSEVMDAVSQSIRNCETIEEVKMAYINPSIRIADTNFVVPIREIKDDNIIVKDPYNDYFSYFITFRLDPYRENDVLWLVSNLPGWSIVVSKAQKNRLLRSTRKKEVGEYKDPDLGHSFHVKSYIEEYLGIGPENSIDQEKFQELLH